MTVLFDLNILLYFFRKTPPHYQDAALLWQANLQGLISGYIATTILPQLFNLSVSLNTSKYYPQRVTPTQAVSLANRYVHDFLTDMLLCTVEEIDERRAETFVGKDYDDNVLIACADRLGLDVILTENIRDFRYAPFTLQIFTPAQLLHTIGLIK